MNEFGKSNATRISRRFLARAIGGAAAAAILPVGTGAAEETPFSPSPQSADTRTEALVEAALSVTPARLTPEQRLDVRRAVRDTQKSLLDVRKVALGSEIDPATVFLPKP